MVVSFGDGDGIGFGGGFWYIVGFDICVLPVGPFLVVMTVVVVVVVVMIMRENYMHVLRDGFIFGLFVI